MNCSSNFFYNDALEECVSCRSVCEDMKKRGNSKYCKDMCKDFYETFIATTSSNDVITTTHVPDDVITTTSVPDDNAGYWILGSILGIVTLLIILFMILKKRRTCCQQVCCQQYIIVEQGNERQNDPAEQTTLTLEEKGDELPQPDSGIDSSYTETETSACNSVANIPTVTIENDFGMSEIQVTDRYLKLASASELRTSN